MSNGLEVHSNYTSLVQILDGPAVASPTGELKQWYPDKAGNSYSYSQVKAASERVSGLLQETGLEHGDRVMMYGPNSPMWPAFAFGVMRSGGVLVPFDINGEPEFFDKVFEATQPRVIIAGADQRQNLRKDYGVSVLGMENAFELHAQEQNDYSDVDVTTSDLANIVFTSGSTGNPKGVMLSHGNIGSNVESLASVIPLDSDNRLLSLLPLSHMFEFNPGLLTPMHLGASIVYTDTRALRTRPENLMRAIGEEHITAMAVVPEVLKLMKMGVEHRVSKEDEGTQKKFRFAKNISPYLPLEVRRKLFSKIHEKMGGEFEFFLVGGSALDPELADYWEHLGVNVLQGYGMTEVGPVVTADRISGRRDHQYVGHTIPGVEMKIVKEDEDEVGEIYVKSPGVMQGYYNNERATSDVLDKDGWYHTHDMGKMDTKGRLQVMGRNDFMISLTDGHNVFPEDVEQIILRHTEGVLGNAMVYGEKSNGKVRLRAVLFGVPGNTEIDAEIIIQTINKQLLPYQKITESTVWPTDKPVPQTATRKLKRKDVLKQLEDLQQN